MNMVAKGRKTTDGAWGITLARDWKPDWGWSSLSGGYDNSGLRFTFTNDPAPCVQYLVQGDAGYPPAKLILRTGNPSAKPLTVKATLQLQRNNMPDLKEERVLTLAPHAQQDEQIDLDANDPTAHFTLTARVTSAEGTLVYYDRQTSWSRAKERLHWSAEKPKTAPPVDFNFAYYPSTGVMRIAADLNGLPKSAQVEKVTAVICEHWSQQKVKTLDFPLPGFVYGRQEQRVTLPALDGDYDIQLNVTGQNVPPARWSNISNAPGSPGSTRRRDAARPSMPPSPR